MSCLKMSCINIFFLWYHKDCKKTVLISQKQDIQSSAKFLGSYRWNCNYLSSEWRNDILVAALGMQSSQKHHLAKITIWTAPLYSMNGSCFTSYQDLNLVGLAKEVCKWRVGGLERLKVGCKEGGGWGGIKGKNGREGEKGKGEKGREGRGKGNRRTRCEDIRNPCTY